LTEKIEHKFSINDEDVTSHAPLVYHAIQEHYVRIGRLIESMSDDPRIKQSISLGMNYFGILPNKDIRYESIFLKNDDFKISVIFHLCLSNIIGTLLSWEAYLFIYSTFRNAYRGVSEEPMGVDSIMLKSFNVNPNAIPISCLNRNMMVDEFNKATVFIIQKLQPLKRYQEGFSNYDDYFDYMKYKAKKILSDCHDNEFYSTHEIDRFTCACISSKMKLPEIDTLYNIEGISNYNNVSVDNIMNIQEQILKKVFHSDEDKDNDEEEDDF